VLPPVVHGVREPLGDGQERVAPAGQRAVEPTGVDTVIEPEGVEVALVGEVQCRRWAVQSNELEGCRVGADPAGREALSGGGDRVVGCVADPEAARRWVEPVARGGEPVPGPGLVGVGVEAPPGLARGGDPEAGGADAWEAQDWSPVSCASATADSTSPSASRSAMLAPSAAGWGAMAMASASIGSGAVSRRA